MPHRRVIFGPLFASSRVCEHERTGEKTSRSARNESAALTVETVGKQSPYNPGEM